MKKIRIRENEENEELEQEIPSGKWAEEVSKY